MKWIFSIFIITSLFFSIISGRISELNTTILKSATDGIDLWITLASAMILWCGITNVAKDAKLTEKIAKFLIPIAKFIFKDIPKNATVLTTISLSMCANLLGIGNAATPLGLKAMQELEDYSNDKTRATKSMILFTLLNTASIQLIPTTIAVLRSKYESQDPMSIIVFILPISIISLIIGLILANICLKRENK